MGTTGPGRFKDYSDPIDPNTDAPSEGAVTPDPCGRAFSVQLEDVQHSDYYRKHSKVPSEGTPLYIEHRKRIVATVETGESVGSLPTRMNYLAECLKTGFEYHGVVKSATQSLFSTIHADFAPAE